ncbi:sugar phosphate isomerase/epimerase [Salipiger sp. IMCC34102]|uniref:sugar phosphate isomerase/epimerase family protein n=1 Tax=Salipiger sp. IMCC34102 TaxID=2510647 RepID=UPI00101C32BA|nr:sugar phosphate isomerase/epimerase [Salipiger sp. IMCC34102]RYH04519.1 sugar phosphate isomerase/epimerase [Salipiger sp. IMCC34102]
MQLSYQLYSARNAGALEDILDAVAKAGFTAVEGYGGVYGDPQKTRAALDAHGLTMPGGHFALWDVEADAAAQIEIARALGVQTMIAPFLMPDDRPTDRAGWEAFATRVAEAGKPVRDAGLAWGWHNHDFELVDLGGVTPLDLIAQADADTMLELDIGWVNRAGADPLRYIADYGSQIVSAHIKDIAPEGEARDEDGWADVGQGVTDWGPIHAALKAAGVTLYVAEHDNPSDAVRFARRSAQAMKSF